MVTFGLEEVAGAVAIKASEWEAAEPPQEPRRGVGQAKVRPVPENSDKEAEVCYTQPRSRETPSYEYQPGDKAPTDLVELRFPDKWGRTQTWTVERWQARMAMAADNLVWTAPAIVCVDLAGTPRRSGWAREVFLHPTPSEPGVAMRPEIMLEVANNRRGNYSAYYWPLGLCLFEIEGAAK